MLATLITPAPTVSAAPARVTLLRLQDGLYAARAANAEASRANAGEVVPTLVHTTGNGVLVVDPGPHARWGHQLIASIRHITAEPVRWVVNTHAHPEHVLANAAFAQLQPRPAFLASASTTDLMRQRCQPCLARLTALLGAHVMRETQIVYPEPALRDGDWLHTGKTAWQVRIYNAAHSASDTVLYAAQRGVLCTGGLAYRQRVPDLQEGSLVGWQQALHALTQLPANIVVGTAIGTPAQMLQPTLAYLDMLASTITRAMETGGDAARALDYVPGDAYRDWRNFHPRHALNVARAWRELEDRWMQSAPSA
ncbi:MBL fold metallo-hydrolase [Ralstonia pickettii]|uniref:MBL fold metallo-hydrolase n=1 Tax=Ralstonia pickettii TaxID=329 RepID=UPI000818A3B9|nr:MBL fold metallo-hydrolase [Ralstonia pickettii]OCS44312.1 MBL fold metallo-hydrolase [Ralstonia pickettii]